MHLNVEKMKATITTISMTGHMNGDENNNAPPPSSVATNATLTGSYFLRISPVTNSERLIRDINTWSTRLKITSPRFEPDDGGESDGGDHLFLISFEITLNWLEQY